MGTDAESIVMPVEWQRLALELQPTLGRLRAQVNHAPADLGRATAAAEMADAASQHLDRLGEWVGHMEHVLGELNSAVADDTHGDERTTQVPSHSVQKRSPTRQWPNRCTR